MSEWIKFNGGKRPVPASQAVIVRFRCDPSTSGPNRANRWIWRHNQGDYDIIAYRIVSEESK